MPAAPTLAQVLQGFAAANAAAKPVPLPQGKPQGRLPGVPPPVVKNAPTFDLTASPFAGAQHPFAQAQHQAAVKLDRAQRAGPNGRLPLAPAPKPSGGGGGFDPLGLVSAAKDAGSFVGHTLQDIYGVPQGPNKGAPATAGSTLATAQSPYFAPGGSLGLVGRNLGTAFGQSPVQTTLHTVGQIPGAANGLIQFPLHVASDVATGHPGAAAKEVAGLVTQPLSMLQHASDPGEVQRLKSEGALPELLTFGLPTGGAVGALGRAGSKFVAATGVGKAAFEAAKTARDARTTALQQAHSVVAQNRDGAPVVVPPKLQQSLPDRAKSLLYEAAATGRPARRYGTDQAATPAVQPVGAPRAPLVARDRSPNLIVSAGQTAIDRSRIAAQQDRLQRVVDVATRGHLGEQVPYAAQLDTFTKPGEVVANVRGGGITGRFGTTARGQVASVNAAQQDGIRLLQEENRANTVIHDKAVADLNPGQRELVTFVKEGKIPAHDPATGMQWLGELKRQVKQERVGTGGRADYVVKDLANRNIADNLQTIARAREYIDKHGAGAVFNPDFERKAAVIQGEKATAHRDPTLTPDTVMAKRYTPQVNFLDRWAKGHPSHPDAPATAAAVAQVREHLDAGHDLRVAGDHPAAEAKFTAAYNLHREMALNHGLPTDLAYMPHLATLGKPTRSGARDFRVDAKAPGARPRNQGILDRVGHTVRDPELLQRASNRNLANERQVEFVKGLEKTHGVGKDNMTAREALQEMAGRHLDPEHHVVMSLGQFRRDIAERERQAAGENIHLDADPQGHASAMRSMLDQSTVGKGAISDTAKGFKIYPTAVARELQHSMTPAQFRALSRAKGQTSKFMLGTSPSWALSMWPAYYVQGAMGGALSPISWVQGARWHKGLDPEQRRTLDVVTGVDSPVTSSHGIVGVHNPAPPTQLADGLALFRGSPIGRMLAGKSPVTAVLRFERIARVESRHAVIYKDLRKAAVRKMVEDSRGLMDAQGKVEAAMRRMTLFGRGAPEKYMQAALADTKVMEAMVAHVHNVLGDFHHFSRFERSTFQQVAMFYPWIRYSVKTAFHVLPARHPMLLGLAAYMGTLGEQQLTDLLGTAPNLGNLYVGQPQPNTPAGSRSFQQIGLHSLNPLLNSVMDVLDAPNASKAIGALPPYVGVALDWIFHVDSFTGKPLKDVTGKPYADGSNPSLLPFAVGHYGQAFAPVRALSAGITQGAPQAADSAPFIGMSNPLQTARAQSTPKTGRVGAALNALLPFVPRPAPLAGKIAAEQKAGGASGGGFQYVPPGGGSGFQYKAPGGGGGFKYKPAK